MIAFIFYAVNMVVLVVTAGVGSLLLYVGYNVERRLHGPLTLLDKVFIGMGYIMLTLAVGTLTLIITGIVRGVP